MVRSYKVASGWVPEYPDTPVAGAATRDLFWFIEIHHAHFPRVCAIKDFRYPNRLHLVHHIKFRKTSDIFPRWGAYIEYPLPTEWGTCTMATGIGEKMGGPHVEDSSSWSWTDPPSLSCLCPFCNKSHNSRDSLMNHIQFHYRMVLMCLICGSCGSNHWRIVEGHIKKCAAV